jgi:hypothetical protein
MRYVGFLCVPLLISFLQVSAAEDGCCKFAWSLARERDWFASPEKLSVGVGQTLAAIPNGAFTVKLQPGDEAWFELPPERKPKSETWFGGSVRLPALERGGIYQVTVSDEAWIDVVQEHRFARSVGSTGRSDCAGVRKSVRLELGPAPFTVQLSAVAIDAIVLAIGQGE